MRHSGQCHAVGRLHRWPSKAAGQQYNRAGADTEQTYKQPPGSNRLGPSLDPVPSVQDFVDNAVDLSLQ